MISDPEFQILKKLSSDMEEDYEGVDWTPSPFAWIQSCSSSQKGAIFKNLVDQWCVSKGLNVSRSAGRGADRIIEGIRVKIKGSSLWGSGTYTFQQLRDENYDLMVCLGISPFRAHCWAIPKDIIMSWWEDGTIRTQHSGRSGSDNAWLQVDPNDPPYWLSPWGGSLSHAYQIIVQEA